MTHNDTFTDLLPWQRAFVNREVLNILRANKAYRHLEAVFNGDDHDAAVHADEVMCAMWNSTRDEVLGDVEFMDTITLDAEDRYMTRGNNALR